jgi:hypothetical protein
MTRGVFSSYLSSLFGPFGPVPDQPENEAKIAHNRLEWLLTDIGGNDKIVKRFEERGETDLEN